MPKYRVQLKQGSRTVVNTIEAKSVASAIAFFETLSTMKVTEVLKIEYENDTLPPVDDFLYFPLYKGIMHTSTRLAKQMLVNNVKMTKSELDIAMACKEHLEINGSNIDSLYSSLFKTKNT